MRPLKNLQKFAANILPAGLKLKHCRVWAVWHHFLLPKYWI